MLTDEQIKRLPPVARAAALHKPLPPVASRVPWIGIGITILIHIVIVAILYIRGGRAPDYIVYLKLFPLHEPAAKTVDAAPPTSNGPSPPAQSQAKP